MTPHDAVLLSTIGGKSLIESHGHSAPVAVMQSYVHRAFSVEACAEELADETNLFYLASYKGEPAGYSKISFRIPHPAVPLQPVTKLERLYLLKEFFDLKLGHLLLEKAIALSKDEGEKGMWLNVWKENGRALRFYEKQGFVTVGESEFGLTETHANPNWVMLLHY